MKPILFNTKRVRAILDGRKTVDRRVVKPQPLWIGDPNVPFKTPDADPKGIIKPPYNRGDILYVRETWCKNGSKYLYKAGCPHLQNNMYIKWKPSIHMPKKLARIFLKVTDVRVDRLHDITEEQALSEGIDAEGDAYNKAEHFLIGGSPIEGGSPERFAFIELWNSTIKKRDLDKYGWGANPWVRITEFERVTGSDEQVL